MQDDTGLKGIFRLPWAYEKFQDLVGARRAAKWLARNYWRVKGGEKVVDMGCGPGTILNYLPEDIEYIGFDISENYIRTARRRFPRRGTFLVCTARDFLLKYDNRLMTTDLVTCNGLLHHLDDHEAIELLEISKEIMKPTGRLVCFEPTFLDQQGHFSKWIMSKDRGRNIRPEKEWEELTGKVFESVSTDIATGLLRIPYVHIIMECRRSV